MPKSTHVIDSEKAALIAEYREIEKNVNDHEKQIERERYLVLKDGTAGTRVDPLHQWGRQMSHTELESKILPYLPSSFGFDDHPGKANTRWLYQIVNGERVYITAYGKGFIPERSIHWSKDVIRPVSGLYKKRLREVGGVTLSGRDMPSLEKVRNSDAPGGFEYKAKDENALMPGWRRDFEVGPEKIRGWRTVVIYLKNAGVLSPEIAEQLFGADDTPEWAGHIGKAKVSTPW